MQAFKCKGQIESENRIKLLQNISLPEGLKIEVIILKDEPVKQQSKKYRTHTWYDEFVKNMSSSLLKQSSNEEIIKDFENLSNKVIKGFNFKNWQEMEKFMRREN